MWARCQAGYFSQFDLNKSGAARAWLSERELLDIDDDNDGEDDDVCTINRQELLTALLLGSGFRSLSLQIRQVSTYVPLFYDNYSEVKA